MVLSNGKSSPPQRGTTSGHSHTSSSGAAENIRVEYVGIGQPQTLDAVEQCVDDARSRKQDSSSSSEGQKRDSYQCWRVTSTDNHGSPPVVMECQASWEQKALEITSIDYGKAEAEAEAASASAGGAATLPETLTRMVLRFWVEYLKTDKSKRRGARRSLNTVSFAAGLDDGAVDAMMEAFIAAGRGDDWGSERRLDIPHDKSGWAEPFDPQKVPFAQAVAGLVNDKGGIFGGLDLDRVSLFSQDLVFVFVFKYAD